MSVQSTFYSTNQAVFGGKLYSNVAEEGAVAPYGVFARVVGTPENNLSGYAGITKTVMQLDIWAATHSAALALAAAVRVAMDASAMQQTCEMEHDFYEPDVKLHRVIQEFTISHT